jgi:hypothetical protein
MRESKKPQEKATALDMREKKETLCFAHEKVGSLKRKRLAKYPMLQLNMGSKIRDPPGFSTGRNFS